MKATIKGIEVEGTPEEISKLIKLSKNNAIKSNLTIDTKIAKYMFVGANQSMGFTKFNVYNLVIDIKENGNYILVIPKRIPYSSSDSFYDNWMPVK